MEILALNGWQLDRGVFLLVGLGLGILVAMIVMLIAGPVLRLLRRREVAQRQQEWRTFNRKREDWRA